jgi:hypothetical protein
MRDEKPRACTLNLKKAMKNSPVVYVLYRGLRKSKLQFLIKKFYFFPNLNHQNPGSATLETSTGS